ncbi:MAG TPA: helix-turn-helix domain-containing protein [Tepidisphaeraceae bacterium]|jgi:excisionase family DNA binding protein|nr:helix-turn-helix domain-containing protein [Tepidisphaeraceae bacterium]
MKLKLLTVTQVAEKLGVSRSRVLFLVREGRVPGEKLGSQYVIKPADLAKVRVLKPGRPKKAK